MDDTRILPFAKPSNVVRLPRPDAEGRKEMFEDVLSIVCKAEADPEVVAYSIVFLCDDGKRRSSTGGVKGAYVQLSKQVRREAAAITRTANKEWV